MTPIKDYKPQRKLIDMTPRQRYFTLLELGLSEQSAAKMSGWDEQKEIKAAVKSWLLLAFSIIVAVVSVSLVMSPASDGEEDGNTEAWFAACLNGITIQAGDKLVRCISMEVTK